jgi:hypothetical protein
MSIERNPQPDQNYKISFGAKRAVLNGFSLFQTGFLSGPMQDGLIAKECY